MPIQTVFVKIAPLITISLLALAGCAGSASDVGSDEPPLDSGPGYGDGQTPSDPIPVEGIDGTWTFLDGIDADGAMTVDTTVTLVISGDSISGESTCNYYAGSIDGGPNDVTITEFFSTERGCIDDAGTTFESRYFAALAVVTVAIPTGGSLVMQGDGVTMNFLPKQSLPEG